MVDKFAGHSSLMSQAERWLAIAPDDDNDLPEPPKALYFNGDGTVVLVGSDGHSEPFLVAAGQTLDCRPVRIKATGTTVPAGGIIGLWD